eukprot:gene3467-6116_t
MSKKDSTWNGTKKNDKKEDNNSITEIKKKYDIFDSKHHEKFGLFRRGLSTILISSFVMTSKFHLTVLNNSKFIGERMFHDIVNQHYEKNEKRGLLTISNHNSTLDEPSMMSVAIDSKWAFHTDQLRYAICAEDMCFKNVFTSEFFKLMKALPVKRGGGIEQKGMNLVIDKLNQGEWIHYFPEGKISQNGIMNKIKKGTSKLILETDPIVIPIYHEGMEKILPKGTYLPKTNKNLRILLGNEIKFSDILEKHRKGEIETNEAYDLISNRIKQKFDEMKSDLDDYNQIKINQ